MMHKAWSGIEEVPYCFSRSYIKLQGHTVKKMLILTQIERFRTVTPVWIHWWLWNNAQSLTQYRRGALLFFKSSIKFEGYMGKQINDLIPILTKITWPVAAIKSLRFPCLTVDCCNMKIYWSLSAGLLWRYCSLVLSHNVMFSDFIRDQFAISKERILPLLGMMWYCVIFDCYVRETFCSIKHGFCPCWARCNIVLYLTFI